MLKLTIALIVGFTSAVSPALTKEADDFFLEDATETAIARSAAPKAVSESANIWVLTPDGYKKVIEGENGFNCLVLRKWSAIFDAQKDLFNWDALSAPICYDPVASSGPMQEQFLRHKLGLEGKSHDEIKHAVYTAYAEGSLPLPPGVSFAYMYSSAQNLSPTIGRGQPHVMVYAPDYTNAMMGGNGVASRDPIVFEAPGTFRAIVAIPVNGRSQHIDPMYSE